MRIRRNDRVVLTKAITGAKHVDGRAIGKEAKGAMGGVLAVMPKKGRVIVEGINYVYKHVRRSQTNPRGGRVAKEAAIDIGNVMLYCPKCDGPTRVTLRPVEKTDHRGKRRREVMRICRRCGESIGGEA